MAKKGSSNGRSSAGYPDIRFIKLPLRSSDKQFLREVLDPEVEYPPGRIEDLVCEGYKFSLSYDQKNSTFIASITDKSSDSDFHNCCLSARGSTPANARYALLYKHDTLCGGYWGEYVPDEKDQDTDFG